MILMARQREKLTDSSSTAGKGLEDLKPWKQLRPTDRAVVRPMLRWPVTVEIPVSTNQKGHPAPRFGCCLCPYSVWKPDQLLQCQRWSSARAVPSGEPESHQLRLATAQSRQALGAYSGKRGGQGWPFNHGRCPHPLLLGGSMFLFLRATVSPSILYLKAPLKWEVPQLTSKACLCNSTDGAGSCTGLAQMQVMHSSC